MTPLPLRTARFCCSIYVILVVSGYDCTVTTTAELNWDADAPSLRGVQKQEKWPTGSATSIKTCE